MGLTKIINFTADTTLLNKFKNQQGFKTITQEVVQQTASEISETQVKKESETLQPETSSTEQNNHHKVRNWSIGLGSAAVLISLGVLGRNGYLGKGMQKFLGGIKKNANEFADELKPKINDIADDVVEDISHNTESTANKADDIIKDNTSDKTETILGKVDDNITDNASDKTETILGKADDNTSKSTQPNALSKKDLNKLHKKLDAQLDKTIPEIKDYLHVNIPKTQENFEELVEAATKPNNGLIEKNGIEYLPIYDANKNLTSIFTTKNMYSFDKNGKIQLNYDLNNEIYISFNKNGEIDSAYRRINKQLYTYDSNGNLKFIQMTYELNNRKIKKIILLNGNGEIQAVSHIDSSTNMTIKEEFYNNLGQIFKTNYYDNIITKMSL